MMNSVEIAPQPCVVCEAPFYRETCYQCKRERAALSFPRIEPLPPRGPKPADAPPQLIDHA